MDYRTVQVELTNPKENITDLMNILAIVSFKANVPKEQIVRDFKYVVDEQYLRSFVSSPIEPEPERNKPMELS